MNRYLLQKGYLKELSQQIKPIFLYGGFAEDALLYHKPSRKHEDIDVFLLRENLQEFERLTQKMGFKPFIIYGKRADRQPFYISCRDKNDVCLEVTIADKNHKGRIYVELAEFLNFDFTRFPPLRPFRLYFPKDAFDYPYTEFDGFKIQTISPLALYQYKAGMHIYSTFGDYREKDRKSMRALKNNFFPDKNFVELAPETELL